MGDRSSSEAIQAENLLGSQELRFLDQVAPTSGQGSELLHLVREAIFILNDQGRIIFWNRGAEELYGWSPSEAIGKSALELLKTELPQPLPQIENILRSELYWDSELKQTTKQEQRVTVASRWALWRDEASRICGRFQLDTDITRRKQIENELRDLSGRLLSLRDEERRRLARDLHDSVGQLLAGAAMNLTMVERKLPLTDPASLQWLKNLSSLLEQSVKEVRTLSYLLHPPLLDEVGLPSALEWYVSGFSERSQIRVALELPENLGRLRHDVELALFRIVQEALTNVHRHSESPTAKVTLRKTPGQVRLTVEDRGKGMEVPLHHGDNEEHPVLGVGISGMRERVRNLGGQMQLRSGSWGTELEILLPIAEAMSAQGSR